MNSANPSRLNRPTISFSQAQRMQGVYVITQHDSEHAPDDARAVLHRDTIATGDYGNNCHGTEREGTRFDGRHTGEFYHPVAPYQIPYGILLPRDVDNLLVPVAASSSHVGFCALRLEPIWMSLGQAAGHAAALAVLEAVTVQEVPVPLLQRRLYAGNPCPTHRGPQDFSRLGEAKELVWRLGINRHLQRLHLAIASGGDDVLPVGVDQISGAL